MPTIRLTMLDLYSARVAYWQNDSVARTYQEIWHEIRQSLARVFQHVLSGHDIEDDTFTVTIYGVSVARFEIK
jgi:hypothetical protein